jgi:hypothetical protein
MNTLDVVLIRPGILCLNSQIIIPDMNDLKSMWLIKRHGTQQNGIQQPEMEV